MSAGPVRKPLELPPAPPDRAWALATVGEWARSCIGGRLAAARGRFVEARAE